MTPLLTAPPLLIAGPCGAESRVQVLRTAAGLAHLPLTYFRTGVWKPRTRPGAFEGAGIPALEWLQEVRAQFGFKIVVEVAEEAHVKAVLNAGIDAVWIGARTTVNPFSVQRLAEALQGAPLQILLKNPVIPDADLWLGGIERFERLGFQNVMAIHRGFPAYGGTSAHRNPPTWAVPIELRRRRPDLKIICDPSHIAGKRAGVARVAQKALDLGLDGLMIEVHENPDAALSDAAQQLTPAAYRELLESLQMRRDHCSDTSLEALRQQMDAVDSEIIDLLARRSDLSRIIGALKKEQGLTAYQPARWREILESRSGWATDRGLDAGEVAQLFQLIHLASVKAQLRQFLKFS